MSARGLALVLLSAVLLGTALQADTTQQRREAASTEETAAASDTARALAKTSRKAALRTRRILRLEGALRATTPAVGARDRSAAQLRQWFACVRSLAIEESGDPARDSGFAFDERDGTGVSNRRALTIHRGDGLGTWDLLTFVRSGTCRSAPTQVGGTADPARHSSGTSPAKVRPLSTTQARRRVAALRRSLDRLADRVRRDEKDFDRFDEWESCLVWLPTTERGDARQAMGFLYESPEGQTYLPTIGIDRSGWDDPDYQLLAFRSTARPFTRGAARCDQDQGESADRVAVANQPGSRATTRKAGIDERITDIRDDLADLREDLEDLRSPIEDFHQFDECMYTVGVSETGPADGTAGFVFTAANGATSLRGALAFDLDGFGLPQHDVLAFPGEEPPQIECNEDAGGVETDE